jgi:L-rhamnose isomerase
LQYWLTRSFVPAENEQGESREDRLGQQELVRVYIPQAVNTVVTDKVAPINRLKEGIVSTVIPKDKIEEVT